MQYFNKQKTRLPESLFFQFAPNASNYLPDSLTLNKLGSDINPFQVWSQKKEAFCLLFLEVVNNGSKTIHGVWDGFNFGPLQISSPELPIVVVGKVILFVFLLSTKDLIQPNILSFKGDAPLEVAEVAQYGVSYNLVNNQWNTNFPLWAIDENFQCTFQLDLPDAKKKRMPKKERKE